MYLQDPVSMLALHRADHRELVADAQRARRRRERRAQRLRRLSRRAYCRTVRRMRSVRRALPAPSRTVP